MNILIDMNHPAHVHFFKNFIININKKGHEVLIVTKKDKIILDLLNEYSFKYVSIDISNNNIVNTIFSYFKSIILLYMVVNKFKPSILLGCGSIRISVISRLIRKPSIIVVDSEHTKKQNMMLIPFAKLILSSNSFFDNYGRNHFKYNSFDELIYLHPNYFKPKKSVLKKYDLYDRKYIIIRIASWKASHDIKQKGFDFKNNDELIQFLDYFETNHIYPIILSEKPKYIPQKYSLKIDPYDIHDLLYYAVCYIGEGATLAAESALLATPSIYVSTIPLGYLNKLKNEYHLLHTCVGYKEALNIFHSILLDKKYKDKLIIRKNAIINNVIDLNKLLVWLIENYPYSKNIIKMNKYIIQNIDMFNSIIYIDIIKSNI